MIKSYVCKAPDNPPAPLKGGRDARGFGVLLLMLIERHLEGRAARWGFGGW